MPLPASQLSELDHMDALGNHILKAAFRMITRGEFTTRNAGFRFRIDLLATSVTTSPGKKGALFRVVAQIPSGETGKIQFDIPEHVVRTARRFPGADPSTMLSIARHS